MDRPFRTAAADSISTAVASVPISPLPANAGLPAHLQDLTERARGYVEATARQIRGGLEGLYRLVPAAEFLLPPAFLTK